jgi:uncharacterized RDD family membrane protein YckC
VNGPPGAEHAGVVTRVLAAVVDTIAVVLLTVVVYLAVAGTRFLLGPLSFRWPQPSTTFSVATAAVIATVYLAVAWATTGRTYGAGLLGLRVLSVGGARLGWVRALLRAVTCVVFPVGLAWSALSRTRRSLQDLVLGSIVVYDWHQDGGAHAAAAASRSRT